MTSVGWNEARGLAHEAPLPMAPVSVPLSLADGLVLAKPLVALVPLPSFDCSAMDGYAVRGAAPWTLVGSVRAGQLQRRELRAGQACEVATGAPLPRGATAVLPYEQASQLDSLVTGRLPDRPQIRWAGEESQPGEELLTAGSRVSPQALGLAAALGYDELWVRPKAMVSALVTGDEVRLAGIPRDGWIRDSIGPALPGLVDWAGGSLVDVRHTPDDEGSLISELSAARGPLVLVSGSTASGPADHLRSAVRALGGEQLVQGVSCRPGHPQCLFRLPDGRLVVGLPGNPFAAMVAFLTLAEPVIAAFQGLGLTELVPSSVPAIDPHARDTRLVPVIVRDGAVTEVRYTGSAMLRGLAVAEALAVVPPAAAGSQAGLLALPSRGGPVRSAALLAQKSGWASQAVGAIHG
jgi:molybdopterin molybdotransferase